MNTNSRMMIVVLFLLAGWPVTSYAQSAIAASPARAPRATTVSGQVWQVQAPPVTVQVPPIQVPPVTVQVPDLSSLDLNRWRLDDLAAIADTWSIESLNESLADLELGQERARIVQAPRLAVARFRDESSAYESGLSALDGEQWQRAVDRFDQVIKTGKTRVDGAMYWKAYALDKLGQRDDALATLETLLKNYPSSRYLDDARALELEVRKGAGQPLKPEDQANEDLKLMALTSVMQADSERAIPLLEQMLKGRNSLKVKERALFLLSTSESPRAREVLAGIAKGGANPDLQLKAIRYLGMRRSSNAALLADIYSSSKDPDVKREIIRSLGMARDVDRLLNIAKIEASPELRIEAIRQLGVMRADDQLFELYGAEKAGEIREQIARSLVMTGNAQRLAEIARQEADPKTRANVVRSLGTIDRAKAGDTLVQIYRSDKDQGVKKAVINALYMQQNAKALVDLARAESDPTMKREIVSRLSTMKSKEATDYMLELLK